MLGLSRDPLPIGDVAAICTVPHPPVPAMKLITHLAVLALALTLTAGPAVGQAQPASAEATLLKHAADDFRQLQADQDKRQPVEQKHHDVPDRAALEP